MPSLAYQLKKADDVTGAGQDVPFEQSFANLAHVYIQDKAPTLMQYELGFQLLDKNDDNTKAVGIAGFKVGPKLLYVPVFFIEGDLKGHEMLYLKDQDLFVPLKETWINYILSRRPTEMGQGVDKGMKQLGVIPPNLYQLKFSPSKYGSAMPDISDWAEPFLPPFARSVTGNPLAGGDTNLLDFVKDAGEPAVKWLARYVLDYPSLMDGLTSFYGQEKVAEAVKEAARTSRKRRSVLSKQYKAKPRSKMKKRALVHVIHYRSMSLSGQLPGLMDIPDGDKEKLLDGKVVIKDERTDDQVTQAYDVTYPQKLFNPGVSGIYEVLVKPSEFTRCAVLAAPFGTNQGDHVVVVRLDNKAWLVTNPSMVWAKDRESKEEFDKWLDSLDEVKSLEIKGDPVVLISPDGKHATYPLVADRELCSGKTRTYDGITYFEKPKKAAPYSQNANYRRYDRDRLSKPLDWESTEKFNALVLTGGHGVDFRMIQQELYIPGGTKKLSLSRSAAQGDKNDHAGEAPPSARGSGSESNPPPLLHLGNLADMELGLLKHAGHRVRISTDGIDYSIADAGLLGREDAVVNLVTEYGLREKVARELLATVSATRGGVREFHFKQADYPFINDEGVTAPPIPDQQVSGQQILNDQVPSNTSQEHFIEMPEASTAFTDRSVYDVRQQPNSPYMMGPDQGAAQSAMQASQMGFKEVFDTSMIGGMMKHLRTDSVVSRHLGSITQTMSRLGKLLMHLYWNRESWSERYGDDDLQSIEDLVLDSFNQLGDLVLTLKEKEVNPNLNMGVVPDLQDAGDESEE